jgi:hypothetical protein
MRRTEVGEELAGSRASRRLDKQRGWPLRKHAPETQFAKFKN